jgi:hypothetical protein
LAHSTRGAENEDGEVFTYALKDLAELQQLL